MPKISYKTKNLQGNENDEVIVSFEEFCRDKGSASPREDFTLNDNLNYRLHYEGDPKNIESTLKPEKQQTELSKNQQNRISFCKKLNLSPFFSKNAANSTVSVHPHDDESEAKYKRFAINRPQRAFVRNITRFFITLLVFLLSFATWTTVSSALSDKWNQNHFRKLRERTRLVDFSPDIYYYHYTNSSGHKIQSTFNAPPGTYEYDKEKIEICALVKDLDRFDCYPQSGAFRDKCMERQCCWAPPQEKQTRHNLNIPYCYYPSNYRTYKFVNSSEYKEGMKNFYVRDLDPKYPKSFDFATVEFSYISDEVLRIKISDPHQRRFEPPYPKLSIFSKFEYSHVMYQLVTNSTKLGFKVIRKSDNVVLFNTEDAGAIILADRFLQLSSLLPTKYIYGLGERRGRFLIDVNWSLITLFNHDTAPKENTNLYGTHPFYLGMEDSGKSHGVLLLNANAMDVLVQPKPAITFRTVGGILDFYIFMGPTPKDVINQYVQLIGKPFMPPYWSLGFHLCKYGYGSLAATESVFEKTRNADIPYDVQWNDLDYMNSSNDFTYDHVKYSGLPRFVQKLHSLGMHFIPLIDPGVSGSEKRGTYKPFDLGMKMNVFIRNTSDEPFFGKVWNSESTVWPDFSHPNASTYWRLMFADLYKMFKFDGAWIDMNEPSNFLSGQLNGICGHEFLPYVPNVSGGNGLKSQTLCMDAVHYSDLHYNLHNQYSIMEADVTNFALKELRYRRPFIISRSTFVGSGRYTGHWSGDIYSDWHDMKMTIPELLSFSMFGIPMMGADICGFNGNTTVELCKRWFQLGAFYPFSRNHNTIGAIPQDPVSLGPEVESAAREFLRVRYTLLIYLYTLFWRAAYFAETVVRPLFFEYPLDRVTYTIDQQFMWGPHVMFVPILNPGVNTTRAYLPRNRWYRLNGTTEVSFTGWGTLSENETVLIRGGGVIPLHKLPENGPITTLVCRSQPIQLLVAPDEIGTAKGIIYWDDGDKMNVYKENLYSHIEFELTDNSRLKSRATYWGFGMPSLEKVTVMGVNSNITNVSLNGNHITFMYDSSRELLVVNNLGFNFEKPFDLLWN